MACQKMTEHHWGPASPAELNRLLDWNTILEEVTSKDKQHFGKSSNEKDNWTWAPHGYHTMVVKRQGLNRSGKFQVIKQRDSEQKQGGNIQVWYAPTLSYWCRVHFWGPNIHLKKVVKTRNNSMFNSGKPASSSISYSRKKQGWGRGVGISFFAIY